MERIEQEDAKRQVLDYDSRYHKLFWPIIRLVGLEAASFLSYLINWNTYKDQRMSETRVYAILNKEDWDYNSPWFWVTIKQAKIDTGLSREIQDKLIYKLVANNLLSRTVKRLKTGSANRYFKINYILLHILINLEEWVEERDEVFKVAMEHIKSFDAHNKVDSASMREELKLPKSKRRKRTTLVINEKFQNRKEISKSIFAGDKLHEN